MWLLEQFSRPSLVWLLHLRFLTCQCKLGGTCNSGLNCAHHTQDRVSRAGLLDGAKLGKCEQNHRFPKSLPTFYGNILAYKILP